MSDPRHIHYDAIALAVDAFKSVAPSEEKTILTARGRLRDAALATIADVRGVANTSNDSALLAECDRAQADTERHA
jgi:hypothetical protein